MVTKIFGTCAVLIDMNLPAPTLEPLVYSMTLHVLWDLWFGMACVRFISLGSTGAWKWLVKVATMSTTKKSALEVTVPLVMRSEGQFGSVPSIN
jgi:hypothetical protein